MAERKTLGHLNYPGDVTHMVGEIVGPTTHLGEYLIATSADFDGVNTKVDFTFATREEIQSYALNDLVFQVPASLGGI